MTEHSPSIALAQTLPVTKYVRTASCSGLQRSRFAMQERKIRQPLQLLVNETSEHNAPEHTLKKPTPVATRTITNRKLSRFAPSPQPKAQSAMSKPNTARAALAERQLAVLPANAAKRLYVGEAVTPMQRTSRSIPRRSPNTTRSTALGRASKPSAPKSRTKSSSTASFPLGKTPVQPASVRSFADWLADPQRTPATGSGASDQETWLDDEVLDADLQPSLGVDLRASGMCRSPAAQAAAQARIWLFGDQLCVQALHIGRGSLCICKN